MNPMRSKNALETETADRERSRMELGLELAVIIRADLANAEWKLSDDVVNEVDSFCVREICCIVDCCVLESTDLVAAFSFEGQNLSIHLNVMPWNLFLIAFGVQFSHARASGYPVNAPVLKDAVNPAFENSMS